MLWGVTLCSLLDMYGVVGCDVVQSGRFFLRNFGISVSLYVYFVLICCIFNDAIIDSKSMVSNCWAITTLHDELERMWKETVIVQFDRPPRP